MKHELILCYREILNRLNFRKHLSIALVVGSILNILNQSNALFEFDLDKINFLKFMITYFVPFLVSIYSAATINNS